LVGCDSPETATSALASGRAARVLSHTVSRPALVLAAGVAFGALLGEDLGSRAAAVLVGLASCLISLALVGREARWGWRCLRATAVALGAAGASIDTAAYDRTPLAAWAATGQGEDTPLEIVGRAAMDSRLVEERALLVIDVERGSLQGRAVEVRGRVRVDVGGSSGALKVLQGETIGLFATLKSPRGALNPGVTDASVVARRAGVHAYGSCKSRLLLRRVTTASRMPLVHAIARCREWGRERIEALLPAGEEATLVKAMVLGDRSGMDRSTAEAFRMAGTYHVLAISGAQVALLAGLLVLALSRLGASPSWVAVLTSTVLALYAGFVGGDVPVVRAAVMATVLLLGRAFDLDADGANLLGLAGGILLVVRPAWVFDVGFQLSFVATLGLIVWAPPLIRLMPRWPLRLEVGLAASLAAQAPLTPLLLLHFHRLPLASLFLNLAAVPLSSAVFLAGLCVLAASLVCPPLAPTVADIAWLAAHALLRSAEAATLMPGLDLRLPAPSFAALTAYVSGLALLGGCGAARRGLALLGVGCALLVAGPGVSLADGRLHLAMLDVGTADCLVVHSPSGRTWVVDVGGYAGRLEPGEASVGPYLWWRGVRRIDRLLLTHAHFDHTAGAPFLVRTFRPREIWEGVSPLSSAEARRLERGAAAARASRVCVYRGVATTWDGVDVKVLWPQGGRRPTRVENNQSVVVAMGFGTVTLLLAGDVGTDIERQIDRPRCQVVKVPHHGSRSSSSPEFVCDIRPRLALVSVGRGRTGFPSHEVLERYVRAGAVVLRTDRDGAILASTDGSRLWVRTERDGRERRLL
jgi:competence protein ComEC